MLDAPLDITDAPDAVSAERLSRTASRSTTWSSATGRSLVLNGIDLVIRRGETVALVGMSGSGKTTLSALIPRFYDVRSGGITLDGVDIRKLTLDSLRRQIGIVTQHTFLFNDSVRNNISYGDPGKGMEDVVMAAKAAHAHDFITELPDGYDTVIGELGLKLSGGQRQRIAIARAVLKNAPILILDEATSALDTESERLVQDALDELMKNRTSLVIAHRLSTIHNATRIVVLAKGAIVEEGSHKELLARGRESTAASHLQAMEPATERVPRGRPPRRMGDLSRIGVRPLQRASCTLALLLWLLAWPLLLRPAPGRRTRGLRQRFAAYPPGAAARRSPARVRSGSMPRPWARCGPPRRW